MAGEFAKVSMAISLDGCARHASKRDAELGSYLK